MATTIKDRTRLDSRPELVGKTVDKYEVVGVVGKGGMGRVYEAINTSINKRVAMKCIDHELAKNPEANARFQREALAASAIESPHIVQIFDAGVTRDGLPFIVMELLRGQDLGRLIADRGRLELAEALPLVAQILKGLHHAHEAGIVHRDLKPDNVFLVQRDDDPVVCKLLDFGVSKIARPDQDVPLQTLTRQGTVVGTPFYMSPEQAQAFPDVDHRTDLYSAGAILYECLTGRAPHVGRAYEQVIVNICMHDAQDVRTHVPGVPEDIAAFIAKALSRERDERFQTAREMLAELKQRAPGSLATISSGSLPMPSTPGLSAPGLSAPGLSAPGLSAPGSSSKAGSGGVIVGNSSEGAVRAATLEPVDTPGVIAPASRPANELADTVGVATGVSDDDEPPSADLVESGITTRSPIETLEVHAKPVERRRWPLALAPGVMVLVGVVLYLGFGRGGADAEGVPDPVAVSAPEQASPMATSAPDDSDAAEEAEAETDSAAEADALAANPDGEEDEEQLHAVRDEGAGSGKAKPGDAPAKSIKAKPKPPTVAKGKPAKPVAPPAATQTKPPEPQAPSLQLQTK
jgi:eukaryotic-like serine/threonine-protein kinase